MRMADVKTAPPLASTSSENPPNEVTQNSKPRSWKSRRGGGGQGGGTGSGHAGTGNDNDHDNGSVGRKKKPELEHYKPGAFGSRKPDDDNNDTPTMDETPQHTGSGNKHSKVRKLALNMMLH